MGEWERTQLEQVLMEQLELQRWYTIAIVPAWNLELFITIQ